MRKSHSDLLCKAAENGNAEAQFTRGIECDMRGDSSREKWFQLAAAQGHKLANKSLDIVKKDRAEEERQRLLAEKKKAEEKRLAEEKEAAILRSIEPNKNPKLWSKGCRLAYRYPEGKNYIIATLEEWNENKTKVKVKIVASPGSSWTLKGESLEKNNTMWVSTHGEGWHLATDAEIEAAIKKDNSSKPNVIYKEPENDNCRHCNGRGKIICKRCDGKGKYTVNEGWNYYFTYTCDKCYGKGWQECTYCKGSGIKFKK